MKLLDLISDYSRAVGNASQGRLRRVPQSLYSVLSARARFQIGPRYHSLYDLIRIPRPQWSEFVIDYKLKELLWQINHGEARNVVHDKLEFYHHCLRYGLPTIPILCAIDHKPSAASDAVVNALEPACWIQQLQHGPDRLFMKLIDGFLGVDAFVAQRSEQVWHFAERTGSLAALHEFCLQRLRGRRGWIVQPVVCAHRGLQGIMSSGALGTVRAVTCLVAGEPVLLYAVLRMPVGSNRVDNFAHGTSGNLTAPIELATGMLGTGRGSKDRTWPRIVDVDRHPDTGERITGFRLPHWPEAQRLIIEAHRTLPRLLKTLGWDVALTDDGPVLVEANSTYDVDILQVSYKRGIKTELLEQASRA